MKAVKNWPAPAALDGEGAQAVTMDGERVSVSPSTANNNRSTPNVQFIERRRSVYNVLLIGGHNGR